MVTFPYIKLCAEEVDMLKDIEHDPGNFLCVSPKLSSELKMKIREVLGEYGTLETYVAFAMGDGDVDVEDDKFWHLPEPQRRQLWIKEMISRYEKEIQLK